MQVTVYTLLFIAVLVQGISAWRYFHQGRIRGGNIGAPAGGKLDIAYAGNEKPVKELWYEQVLDHFNPGDSRTWKQRYFVNENLWNGNDSGPVFLMIGGEGEATIKWMTKGTWITYAERFGALCFQLEHRYYGKSHPTEDLSTKNLQYLTSQQALADLAEFITSMNTKYRLAPHVKWIVFGGSYPGSLAAWMRAKYPHLVHGAMSASGPLLAKIDFLEYFKVVDDALRGYDPKCLLAVQQGTQQVETLLRHMVGQRNLNEKFALCDPIEQHIENPNDVSNLFESLAGNFAGVVQYNNDNRISTGGNITIQTVCDVMMDEDLGPPVTRLAKVNALILKDSKQKCLDYVYDKMIMENRNVSWDSEVAEGGRQWTYQTCTEFGFFQSSTYQPNVFGTTFPVDFFIQQCVDIFGPKYNASFLQRAIDRTNIIYGAKDIDVNNVVFVHGSIDPWHVLGITKTLEQGAPAIYIEGTAHCANMYPERDSDPDQLKQARVEVGNLIDQWLNNSC